MALERWLGYDERIIATKEREYASFLLASIPDSCGDCIFAGAKAHELASKVAAKSVRFGPLGLRCRVMPVIEENTLLAAQNELLLITSGCTGSEPAVASEEHLVQLFTDGLDEVCTVDDFEVFAYADYSSDHCPVEMRQSDDIPSYDELIERGDGG
jgi:hypothetical protein